MNRLKLNVCSLLPKLKKSCNNFQKRFDWMPFPLLILFILSLALRLIFIDFVSGDYIVFLNPWYEFIQKNGGFLALKKHFSDYNMPYLYLLTLATYLPLKPIVAIKLISIIFDYILAGAVFFIILKITTNRLRAGLAFFAILFLPTIILNSALWAQCDVIYTTFVVMSIAALAIKRQRAACIFFGIAIAFKLQAIFIAPLFLLLFLQKKIDFRNLLWIPATFLITLAPAIAIGKPAKDALLVYMQQASTYKFLTMNAPNFYQWLPNDHFDIFNKAGLIFTLTLTIAFIFLFYTRKKNTNSPANYILLVGTFFALLVPFILPQMHERYFFLADILALLLAFTRPKLWFIPILTVSVSLFSYLPFLFDITPISLSLLPLVLIAVLALLLNEILTTEKS